MKLVELFKSNLLPVMDQVANLYANGKTLRFIAQRFNTTVSNVHKNLEKLPHWQEIRKQHQQNTDTPGQGQRKGVTNSMVKKMSDLYAQGQSSYRIAQSLNLSPTTVRYYLKQLPNWQALSIKKMVRSDNPALGMHKGTTKQDIEKMAKLYSQGQTLVQIAAQFGLGKSTVQRHLMALPNWSDVYAANREVKRSRYYR